MSIHFFRPVIHFFRPQKFLDKGGMIQVKSLTCPAFFPFVRLACDVSPNKKTFEESRRDTKYGRAYMPKRRRAGFVSAKADIVACTGTMK